MVKETHCGSDQSGADCSLSMTAISPVSIGVLGRAARKPLCIDLFCGLGGWAEGLLAEGYDVIGFDVERHCYGSEVYPGVLILQSVLELSGGMFKGALPTSVRLPAVRDDTFKPANRCGINAGTSPHR